MGGRAARERGSKRPAEPDITRKRILRHIQKADGRSANSRILETSTPRRARKQIKDILNQLVKEGKLAHHKGNRYEAPSRNLIEGTIVLHRDGYGFVIPEEKIQGIESDIFIPPPLTGSAMNGDKVKVEITLRKPGGRAEGRVVSVEKRASETVVGQLRFDGQVFFVAPSDEKLPAKILITDDAPNTKTRSSKSRSPDFPAPATGLPERSSPSSVPR